MSGKIEYENVVLIFFQRGGQGQHIAALPSIAVAEDKHRGAAKAGEKPSVAAPLSGECVLHDGHMAGKILRRERVGTDGGVQHTVVDVAGYPGTNHGNEQYQEQQERESAPERGFGIAQFFENVHQLGNYPSARMYVSLVKRRMLTQSLAAPMQAAWKWSAGRNLARAPRPTGAGISGPL